jgi:5-methylcytosine-specific restriction endonuclease McrA
MYLKNNFSPKVREVYIFTRNCQKCGRCDLPISIHHILGRVSNSALNSIMLCDECHTSGSYKQKKEFLLLTIRFLLANYYDFNQEDIDFYNKNIKYYNTQQK